VEALMNRVVNPKSKLCRYSDELTLVYAVTVPSYPVLPYMNMHKYPIKIDQADMDRMSDPSTHLRSNTMKSRSSSRRRTGACSGCGPRPSPYSRTWELFR
jgi:hypothetical protein